MERSVGWLCITSHGNTQGSLSRVQLIIKLTLAAPLSPGDGGDPGRHPEGGGLPSDGGPAGPRWLLLRLQQPGRPRPPQDAHRGPGRAVVAAPGSPRGE